MRILHLAREYPPNIVGGAGVAIAGLARALSARQHDVVVIAAHGYDETRVPGPEPEPQGGVWPASWEEAGVAVVRVPRRELADVARNTVLDFRPHVLHIHYFGDAELAREIRRWSGIPVIYTLHSHYRILWNLDSQTFCGPDFEKLMLREERAMFLCDRVLVHTEDAIRKIRVSQPRISNRLRLGGNGIHGRGRDGSGSSLVWAGVHHDSRCNDPGTNTRKGDPLVLYCGRFAEDKATGDVLAAIPQVLKVRPGTRFLMVGGQSTDPSVADEWSQRWRDSVEPRLWDSVRFTGWVSAAQVQSFYREADVLVIPSWYEMFGVVLLEGMLHGLAVVAADAGGPSAVLEDGVTGILFPPGDIAALVQSLDRVLESPQLRWTLGRHAALEVQRKWLWSRVVGGIEAVYGEVVEPKEGRILVRA